MGGHRWGPCRPSCSCTRIRCTGVACTGSWCATAFRVAREASTAASGLVLVRRSPADLLVVSQCVGDLEQTVRDASDRAGVFVLLLTMGVDYGVVCSCRLDTLPTALRVLLSGDVALPRDQLAGLMAETRRRMAVQGLHSPWAGLSERRREHGAGPSGLPDGRDRSRAGHRGGDGSDPRGRRPAQARRAHAGRGAPGSRQRGTPTCGVTQISSSVGVSQRRAPREACPGGLTRFTLDVGSRGRCGRHPKEW